MERINALESRVSELERQLREMGVQRRIPERFLRSKVDAPYDGLEQAAPPIMPMPRAKLHVNWSNPYILDTQAKVDWANHHITDGYVPWKLGDACPFEPPKELSDGDK
jgi:hypothetical protein